METEVLISFADGEKRRVTLDKPRLEIASLLGQITQADGVLVLNANTLWINFNHVKTIEIIPEEGLNDGHHAR